MNILNNIRGKAPEKSAAITRSAEGTPFVSKVAPNKIYSDR